MLIGLTGYAGSGKDTVADYLVREHGFHKYSLASPIKKLLNERFGWTDSNWDNRDWKEQAISFHGRNRKGVTFSPRSWAQWLGTEVGRAIGGDDVWLEKMIQERIASDNPHWVVPDVRFENEARYFSGHPRGLLLRIERPGTGPLNNHSSERGVPEEFVTHTIHNSGSLADLFLTVAFTVLPTEGD